MSNISDPPGSGGGVKLPFGIGDILSLLDRIPIWKRVKALPEQVDALEKRIAVLEAKPNLPICESCGEGYMRRQKDQSMTGPFAVFNSAGHSIAVYKCDKCGFETRKGNVS
jgi:hypothetical protein